MATGPPQAVAQADHAQPRQQQRPGPQLGQDAELEPCARQGEEDDVHDGCTAVQLVPQPPALDGRYVLEVAPRGEADQQRLQVQQSGGCGREERCRREPCRVVPSHQPGILDQQHPEGDARHQRPGELERGVARHRQLQRPAAHQRLGDEEHDREQDRDRHVLRDRHGEQ